MKPTLFVIKSGEAYTLPLWKEGDAETYAQVGSVEIKFLSTKQDGTRVIDVIAMCKHQLESEGRNSGVITDLNNALMKLTNG